MSAEYVRRYYGVDYKRGDRLTMDGRPGTLVSFPDQYLGIRFDGEAQTSLCHPTWRIEREHSIKCFVCGSPCEGTTGATIDDVFRPMCHEGTGTTCYMRWSQHQVTPLVDLVQRGIR